MFTGNFLLDNCRRPRPPSERTEKLLADSLSTSPSFDAHFAPAGIDETSASLTLWYEGDLVKTGDFGGSSTGANCDKDYLFSDGRRRNVVLRLGYQMYFL